MSGMLIVWVLICVVIGIFLSCIMNRVGIAIAILIFLVGWGTSFVAGWILDLTIFIFYDYWKVSVPIVVGLILISGAIVVIGEHRKTKTRN